MAPRTLSSVAPTSNTIALNAFIYGYAGHSMVTPHTTLKQIWWTPDRIEAKVTRSFVISRLGQEEQQQRLHKPIAFDGLTDDTYLDWVLEKARRLFLILADIGAASQIFAVVDSSWDDDDLPLSMEDIKNLGLDSSRLKASADKSFYDMQFTYLLRELHQDAHIDYEGPEIVPLELVMRLPPAVSLQVWDRVHYPGKADDIHVRRKIRFGNTHVKAIMKEFIADVETLHFLEHDHIAPLWASYTHNECGYVLTSFVAEHTLRSFIEHRMPLAYEKIPKNERHATVLTWMLCLADAVAHLHRNKHVHTAIRPSNILIDASCQICFKDIGTLRTLQHDRKRDAQEEYVYGAPEQHTSKIPPSSQSPESEPSLSPLSRTASISTTASSIFPLSSFPTPPNNASFSLPTSSAASAYRSSSVNRSPDMPQSPADTSPTARSSMSTIMPLQPSLSIPEKSDIFSLGCVFLDIITFLLKRKSAESVKHRSAKTAVPVATTSKKRITKSVMDSSFHGNLDKVTGWMDTLELDAVGSTSQKHKQKQKQKQAQQQDAESAFKEAVPVLLALVRDMLAASPEMRPDADEVKQRVSRVLGWSGLGGTCGCPAGRELRDFRLRDQGIPHAT